LASYLILSESIGRRRGEMTDQEDERSIERRERYVGFATYCLQLEKAATDEYSRAIVREMAAEC
jgi:hypothetical protein